LLLVKTWQNWSSMTEQEIAPQRILFGQFNLP